MASNKSTFFLFLRICPITSIIIEYSRIYEREFYLLNHESKLKI
jgi:hypothetical protein